MSNEYYNYIPFAPSNYDNLNTSDDKVFYVKSLIDEFVKITLYKNIGEINRLDKTNYLTEVGNIYGVFRDTTSITDITMTIEYPNLIDFNYVYIPIFNRYYLVTDIRVVQSKLYEIDLSVDVLMSYKNALLKLNAFIDRNENEQNPYIIDKKRVIEQGLDIEVAEIENEVFYKDGEVIDIDNDVVFVLNGYKISSANEPPDPV